MIVKATFPSGMRVAINPDHVKMWQDEGKNGTRIVCVPHGNFILKEKFTTLLKRLEVSDVKTNNS